MFCLLEVIEFPETVHIDVHYTIGLKLTENIFSHSFGILQEVLNSFPSNFTLLSRDLDRLRIISATWSLYSQNIKF